MNHLTESDIEYIISIRYFTGEAFEIGQRHQSSQNARSEEFYLANIEIRNQFIGPIPQFFIDFGAILLDSGQD